MGGEDLDKARLLAVLGGVAESRFFHRLEVRALEAAASDCDRACIHRVSAEDGTHHLGPARAEKARDAEDLAGVDLEADVLEVAVAAQALDVQERRLPLRSIT